jgi:hypothetical protein
LKCSAGTAISDDVTGVAVQPMTVRGSESLRSTIGTAGCMRSVSEMTADR